LLLIPLFPLPLKQPLIYQLLQPFSFPQLQLSILLLPQLSFLLQLLLLQQLLLSFLLLLELLPLLLQLPSFQLLIQLVSILGQLRPQLEPQPSPFLQRLLPLLQV
jgi:hypothetical protein